MQNIDLVQYTLVNDSAAAPTLPSTAGPFTMKRWLLALYWRALQPFLSNLAQGQREPRLPGTVLAGQARCAFWAGGVPGPPVGEPRLCPERYGDQPLALALTYQRNFTAQAIAKRSIEEMRRVAPFSNEQAERWQNRASRLA